VAFDARTLTFLGPEVALFQGVAQALRGNSAADVSFAGQFAVASTGTLAWLRGSTGAGQERALVAVDRQGHVLPLNIPVNTYGLRTRLSPNGRELAMSVVGGRDVSIWKFDLARSTLTPVLQDGEANAPIWTRDGQRLVFFWNKEGRCSLASRRADGTAPPGVLVDGSFMPSSWTPDGKQLAVFDNAHGTLAMVRVERGGRATVETLPQVPSPAGWPELSPDGHWLAYGSSVSGRREVYLQPYADVGERAQVSITGGGFPAWRGDGRALYFIGRGRSADKGYMMEVGVQPGPPLRLGTPKPLFEFTLGDLLFTSTQVRAYDLTPDGQRFFVFQARPRPPMPPVTHIDLILNWFEELKAKVPTSR
jgi:serine/threonine-protein kinase